ncbi:imidazolonepropionase-like domain-containing protein [Streptomyces sp. CA-106110]|uniref:imidazolonepropionase-like domain-containing protein n=1 Tax=Streptomyces sp. CA-106110 TaxID=3240044 RepID=UPI003D8F586C
MLTIHTAGLLVTRDRRPALAGGAILVDGRTCAAVGPYEELAAAHPAARVRRWPGLIAPGLVNPYGPELLEHAYHPDPREAGELGTEPIAGEALVALALSDARWGASARRGVQRMLAHGTVAVAGQLSWPAVVDAVQRAGLAQEGRFERPAGPPSLDPLAGRSLAQAMVRPLPSDAPHGQDATFAVFDVPDEAALTARGAGTCVATVVAGRLVHRRR